MKKIFIITILLLLLGILNTLLIFSLSEISNEKSSVEKQVPIEKEAIEIVGMEGRPDWRQIVREGLVGTDVWAVTFKPETAFQEFWWRMDVVLKSGKVIILFSKKVDNHPDELETEALIDGIKRIKKLK